MERLEIRLSGFGGQGIILAAYILGKAAALHDHKHATMTQNYGPESRGGACSGQVVISDEPVSYPHLTRPNVVVAMSQEAYAKYSRDLTDGGLLLIDEDFVHVDDGVLRARVHRIPATRIAEKDMGRKMVANIVMLGFLAALDSSVSPDALRRSVRESVPKGSEDLNLSAFERGYGYGKKQLESEMPVLQQTTAA
jgi:2-oxoglutarate ferredoxin oxidoreductase subunit gamma